MGRSWGWMVCRLPGAPRRLLQLSTDLAPRAGQPRGAVLAGLLERGSAVSPRGGVGPGPALDARAEPLAPSVPAPPPPPLSPALLLFATCLGWRTVFMSTDLASFETLKKIPSSLNGGHVPHRFTMGYLSWHSFLKCLSFTWDFLEPYTETVPSG